MAASTASYILRVKRVPPRLVKRLLREEVRKKR